MEERLVYVMPDDGRLFMRVCVCVREREREREREVKRHETRDSWDTG